MEFGAKELAPDEMTAEAVKGMGQGVKQLAGRKRTPDSAGELHNGGGAFQSSLTETHRPALKLLLRGWPVECLYSKCYDAFNMLTRKRIQQLKRLDKFMLDSFNWAHEIWHVWAAKLLGVPEWAMSYSSERIEIPYQIGRWRFVVILLAPFCVFFFITVGLIVALAVAVSTVNLTDLMRDIFISGTVGMTAFHFIIWIGALGFWLFLIAFGLLYLHTCLYDLFRGLPTTMRRYHELKPFQKE